MLNPISLWVVFEINPYAYRTNNGATSDELATN